MQIVIETNDINIVEINGKMYANLIGLYECTPLPKRHGRLIDADALNERMKQRHYENADEESYWIADVIETALNPNNGYAPTIIEADKEINR